MSKISSKALSYSYRDTNMSGQFVTDTSFSGPRPGVLVVHEAFGLGKHAINIAERLAQLGYAALAIDLWGERAQINEMPKVMGMIQSLVSDRETWMGRVAAARAALVAQAEVDDSKLAAIGYCFGGATALEYARAGGSVNGVVSFHGGLDVVGSEWTPGRTKARLLVCTGVDDPMVPAASLGAFQDHLKGSGVDWEIDIYSGTKHSFTNPDIDSAGMPDALAYNAQSDRRSWDRLQTFLAEIFRGTSA